MKHLEKCAQILVECGYAERVGSDESYTEPKLYLVMGKPNAYDWSLNFDIDPYADTLEGYRQLFALATYFASAMCITDSHGSSLWCDSDGKDGAEYPECDDTDEYGYFKARVKWCVDKLIEGE